MPEIINTAKKIYGFDPRSIGGCVTWLDGADPTTIFSDQAGTVVATVNGPARYWKDKSGFSNHFSNFSANTSVYYPICASTGGVFVSNAGYYAYNASTYSCLQSVNTYFTFPYYTIFEVVSFAVSTTGSYGLQTLFQARRSAAAESRNPQWGLGGNFAIGSTAPWAFSNSRWSPGDYVGGSYTEFPPVNTVTVMGLTSGTLSNASYVAGVQASSCTSTLYVPWTTNGIAPTIGGGVADNRWAQGNYYEVLVYNCELTARQRQEVEGYLSWKWNRQTALATTHPFRYVRPTARAFTPLDIPNCTLWLDASDLSSVVLSGNNVTNWYDKSGLANNMVSNTVVPTYVTSTPVTGKQAISFAGGGGMSNTAGYKLSSNVSVFVVAYMPTSWGAWGTVWGHYRSGGHDSDIQIRQESITGGYASWHTNNDNIDRVQFTIPASNTPVIFSATMSNGYQMFMTMLYPGTSYSSGLSFNANNSTGVTIATGTVAPMWIGRSDTSEAFNGSISEVVYYQTALSTAQRNQVEGYLAKKWGIALTSHPFTNFPPDAPSKFQPTDINGCVLWFDAIDPLGSGNTSTVSPITTWYDKSGMGSNATAVGTINMVSSAINGLPAVSFAGGSLTGYFTGNMADVGTTISIFAVSTYNGTGGVRLFSFGVAGTGDYAGSGYGFFGSTGGLAYTGYKNGAFTNTTSAIVANVPYVTSLIWDGTNANINLNGGTIVSSAQSGGGFAVTNYALGIDVIATSTDPAIWSGYAGEIVVFNTALSTSERQQMEGYLAWKWLLNK